MQAGHFPDDRLVKEVVVSPVVDALAEQELEHPSRPVDSKSVALLAQQCRQGRKGGRQNEKGTGPVRRSREKHAYDNFAGKSERSARGT